MNESTKWLYEKLSSHGYNVGASAEIFDSLMVNNPESRKWAYNTAQKHGYNVGEYDMFERLIGAMTDGVETTESGSVVVSPAEAKENADSINQFIENRDTLYSGLQDYNTGIISGAEQRRRDSAASEMEAQAEATRQRLQEDGTIDRMEEARKEARREKLRAFGSMLGSTPQVSSFGVSTNVFDSTDEQLADVGQALDAGTEYRQNKLLQEKLDVALDMARAGENQDGLRGVENFGLGLWDSATRLSTWDFGASDIVNNLTLQQIVEKWENDPSSLTATEKKVLDGIGMATAVQELYSDQVGIGYNVGQSLPESAGFMASMALNPASGLGKSLARNAVRTYGRNSIRKNLARIGGDIAETAIMTATTGAGRVAADALERINGSSTYEIADNGVIMYGGQKDQETVGNAVIKAIGANFIENYSEALGEYFDPLLGMSRKVAAGGLRKMNLNKWADALSDVQPSQMTASIRSLREKTKFGGIFGEIMEEEIGMALNTLFVGDNQWSDFVDLETQLTTILSCAIMSGTLNGVEQVSSVAARRRMEKNAKNAEQQASYRFSRDEFAPLREAIDQASPEGVVDVLRDVYMSQEYTVGQKRALAEYAAARLRLQYYNAADAKARRQINKTQQELLDAQEAGLNAQLPQFYNIARAFQNAEDDLIDYDGDWNLVDIIRSSMNKPEEMERILGDLPPREAQLVTNYIYSRARMEGAYQGRSNRAEDYIDDFAYALEPAVVTDAEGNRTITTALLGDRSVYVLENNGDLAHIMRPDGSKTLVKASELTNITTSSAEEVIDRYRDMYTFEYNAETENAFEHHPKTQAPQVGLQLQSPEGEVVITAVNDNMVEIVPAVYKDGQVQPKEGAEPRTITVDDAYAWQDDYYLSMDVDQAYANAMAEANNMSAETAENEGTPTEEIEQSVSEEVTNGQIAETQPTETESVAPVAPAAPQTARERVPKDDKGNPIYEQTDADTAWDAIVEETEGNTEMAQSVAEQMLVNKKAALEKLQKGKAKAGANVAQIIANEKKHQEAIAKAEADVKAWERISQVNAIRQQRAELERAAAEKAEAEQIIAEEIYAEDTDYQQEIATFADENQGTDAGLREDAAGVAEAEDDRAGSSVSAQPDVDFTREEIGNGEVVSEQEHKDGKRKVTDNAEDVRRTPLSELEYVKRETDRLFNEREDQSLSREEWELTDEGVDAENVAIDSYPSYIQSLSDSGELQRMFDLASVGEEIQIRRAVEAAGFELDDVVDTSVKRANAKAARDKKRAEKAKKLIESVTTNKEKQNGAKETIPEGGPRGRRSEKQGENQGDTRQSKSVIGRQIEEFELRTGWSRELSDTERLILEDVRKLTDSEIAALRNEAIESIERGEDVEDIEIVLSLLEKYGRSGERLYILSQSGIIPNQPVLLDKVEQLFMEYNEDEGLAILFDRLRPIIEKINPKITFEVIRDVDGNVKDSTVGDFYLKDNHLRFNLHSLNSSYQTDQEKASTIVHEMIHAITQYAIDANERGDKTLPKNVLEAAKSLVNIYNQIKDNEIFNTTQVDEEGNIIRDYGVKDVHEMISELANPEFREKLKQIDVKGKNAWERIIDAIARFINQFKDIYDTTAYGKAVRALDALMDNFNLDAYEQSMVMSDGQVLCNIRTYREFGRDRLQAYVGDKVVEGILSAEDGADIIQQMDDIYEAVQKYTDVYVPFGNWSETEVVMKDGRPVFSVVKTNGDYKMNLDFSLVCKKRRTLDAVFDELIKRGAIENVSLEQVDIARINDIIRDHAFEVACSLCFVDAKRFRIAEVADDFCKMYNELVDKSDKQLQSIVNKTKKNTVRKKIAQLLLDEPSNRIKLSRENFMSAKGFDDMKVNAEEIMKLYNAKKGTGGPKASSADVQYHSDILDKNWTPEAAYSVGGVRLQSFSDYVPRLVFDYIQMIADLSAKQLPVHAYTKEELFARQFGLTGIKINMSLVPSYRADGVAAGLDKDGNYVWEQGQTFDYDEAVEIQNAEGYRENCGTIAVGVSDAHISKMLDDENIRMVIPYHKSGINKKVAVHNHIDKFTDYTNEQSTRDAKGKKLSKEMLKDEPNFNENLRKLGDPRAAAQAYLDWCDEKGYLPKFDKWRNHPNYYKLLEDFTTIIPSESGEQVVPQRGVTMTFPNEGNAFGSLESLIARGLEEDAVLEGRRDKEVPVIADEVESELLRFRDDNNAELKEKYTDEQIFDAAKQKFGVTDDIREAGYILPDGSMLDFSGRYAVDGDASHLKGGRNMDHREVNQIAYDANDNETGLETNMTDFIERGAIRIHYSNSGVGVINLNIAPTKEQKAKLRQLISAHNGNMDVDFGNGWNTEHNAEYDKAKPTKILGDIDRYYNEGVRPEGDILFREGEGAISDREVSYENDPIAKFQGKPRYYGKRAAAFAERERRRMENAAKEAAEMLGIEAEIVTDASTLQGRKAKAKGWYDIVNKKVVVVVPNHVSMGDAVRTVLHEGVAHHGLRELFGDGFDAMLDNVYNNVAPELKARIDAIAERTGVSIQVATEEYLASLAETTNFEEAQRRGWWQQIKRFFVDILNKLAMPGLNLKEELTDNELRYLLWRSYKNLVEPNSYAKPLGFAEDVVKQKELKVGEYAEKAPTTPMAADTSEAEEWAAVTVQRIDELEAQAAQLENEIAEMEADRDADDASRYEMWEQQLEPLRKQMEDVYAELEGLYSLEAEDEDIEDYEAEREAEKQRQLYQKRIDNAYLKAVREGDWEEATDLFRQYVLSKAEDEGIVPMDYGVGYRGGAHSSIAKKVKEENPDAIAEAAYQMSIRIPKGSILVPMPSRTGNATYTVKLAEAIAKATDSEVRDVLKGKARMSVYEAKQKGIKMTPEDLGMYTTEELPKGKNIVIIDNVIDKGTTALAAVSAVKGASVVAYAYTLGDKQRAATLKLAEPVTYDDNMRIIPLSRRFDKETDDIRYRTSEEIEAEYPNWMEGTTTDSGKHSTQVEGTRKTYNKVGDWIEENLDKDVAILDASSGMGYGTADLRERGFNIEDVEPYQSEERKKNNPATYSSYADIDKKYDFIISNAVLNVIPDDWRRDVLHNMAERMNDGGKLFINTRKAGEEKAIKDKIELDTPQEVLVKRNGKIASYQKFFTPQELKAWVESELGDGYIVEVANKKNSGTSGLAAVMVTKKADSGLRYSLIGGNKGYVGYSMSKRASQARAEGRFPKTDFKKEYGINDKVLDALVKLGIINNTEWHHTSKFGNRTPFYGWEEVSYADYYEQHREEIAQRVKAGETDGLVDEFEAYEEKQERLRRERLTNDMELTREYGQYREENAPTIPDEYNASNGVKVVTNGSSKHSDWRYYWGENEAFKKYARAAESELSDKLRAEDSRMSFTEWKAKRNSEEIIAEVERESAVLGVPVRIARSVDELPDEDTRKRAVDGKLRGYFDTRTGEVVVYEPNTADANDAKRTILHEIVGHKGLRRLIGEQRYDKAMLQLMYMLPADVRDAVLRRAERHGWNAAIAMDEYLADQAERDVQPSWWGKVNAMIRALLRNMGFNVMLTDADVTYLLWRSRKKLQGDSLNDMAVNAILKQAARKSAEAEEWNEQTFKDMEMRDFERNALPSIRHRMGADTNDYDKAVRTLGFKQAESWQDSMRSLLVFQQALAKASGKDISDFENAYMYENRMSSANLMEMEQYRHMVYNPLLKEIHELEQMGASRESIINYLFAKSGLERNEVFARRDAKKHAEGDAAKEQQLYDKYRQKDYAGLTALTRGDAQIAALVDDHSKKKTEYDRLEQNKKRGVAVSDADLKAAKKEMNDARKAMITAIEAEAQRMVAEFEAQHNTDNLWDKIRNCTHTTLNISHDAGVMSDEVYNELWNQFQYYIPLRGFAETTAEDVYLYLGGSDSPYNAPIKTAYGRTSLADDPIATIGNMAESAIVEANRNRLKQRFLYMVERHNTDLASINNVWLEYDDVNDEWHTVFAQIPDDATPSEAKRLQQEFEDRMKLLAEQNPGKYANASQQPNIPYRVVKKKNQQAHHIVVKRNGKDVVITINGNPRVAQAINGLTNPEQNQGMITRITSWINRNLSANFTMRNPAFMVSNFVRDGFYTNSMVWVKENPAYARQYNKNWAICTAQIASLVKRYKRYEKGDTSALDMSNDMDRMFYEFMINGGKTGYTVIKSVEDYKGLISGEMKKMEAGAMGTARRVADTIGNVVDTFGRWAEDTSRFAAYMTSRQLGRTITKSIWDAKEISVNFNKKGSGNRMMGKFKQGNRLNYVLSNMSQLGRNLYVFWNAGMQGLNNFSKAAKKSPAKFTAMAGTYFTLGVIVAAAFSGDDDEDDYYNLPEYVRRNNICFKIGKGKYATLPLPIEIRAIYGLGELAYSYLSGREGLTHGEAVTKTIQQMTQVMPIDMMADGGGAMALVPSAAKPVVEVIHNVDWTGRPIYKEKTPWNQNDPTWTLAFKSTSPELVQMSRLVSEWTNKNTADGLERPYNRGWADNRYLNNPAVWEHIAEGYLGGVATMFNQTKKTLMMPFNEELREVRNVPIVSRFVKDAGKEGRSYAARNEYYDAKNTMDSWKNEMSKAKKEVLDESLTDEQRLKAAKLRSSLEQQYMEAAERWKVLDRQRKALEEAYKSDQSDENRQAWDDVMMQMATLVEAFRD